MKKPRSKPVDRTTTITNCTFTGVQFDPKHADAVIAIATGLQKNAEGLCALADVLRAGHAYVGPFIQTGTAKGTFLTGCSGL